MSIWAIPLILATLSSAAPRINLPVNAQVPPVAIADQAYKFVFSESTFTSTAGPITYALGDCPTWLKLDGSSRTFHGNPGSQSRGPGEDGSFIVDLVATDATGTATMPVTFVVTTDPGPRLGTTVAAQLPAFGAFSTPDTLLLTPGAALSLTFSPNTFVNTNVYTMYYAMCTNNTPLPSWVNFDPISLTFSGITPQATSPSELPQTFGIQLAASQVSGFAQAVTSFELVIDNHMFTFGNSLQMINATFGSPINFTSLRDDLTLDGQLAQRSDIAQVISDAPPWLSLNNSTLTFTGTTPADALQQNFSVTVTDRFGDSASTLVLIQIPGRSSSTLIRPIGPLNAKIGTNFTSELNAFLPSAKNVNIAVDPGTASAWLEFDSNSLKLYGHVPSNLKPQTVQFNVTATQGAQSQSQIVDINVTCGNTACPSVSIHGSAPRTTAGARSNSGAGRPASKSWIAAAVIASLAAVVGVFILWWCCCKRGRRSRLDVKHEKSKKVRKLIISRPVDREKEGAANLQVGQLWAHSRHHERLLSEAPRSPKIQSAQKSTLQRISRLFMPTRTTNAADKSPRPDSWGKYISELDSGSLKQRGAMRGLGRVPGEQTAPLGVVTTDSIQTSQSTNTLPPAMPIKSLYQHKKSTSNIRHNGFGMFSNQPTSGFGHGRNGPSQESSSVFCVNRGIGHGGGLNPQGPPDWGLVRNSWRNLSRLSWTSTQSSPNSNDPVVEEGLGRPLTQKTFSSMLSSFPRPSTSNTIDAFPRSNIILEASADEESSTAIPTPLPANLPRVKTKSSFRKKGIEALQDYHKYRIRQGSQSPWFSANLSTSSKTSNQIGPNPLDRPNQGDLPVESVATPKRTLSRSYSRSSSVEPKSFKSSPGQSSRSNSSHGEKNRINSNFATRALSLRRKHSSYASTTTSSRGSDAVGRAPFYPHGALLEDTDEEGNKQWRHPNHPDPLGTNRTTDARKSTVVSDAEPIDSLRAAGRVSAAQRLSYLRSQTEGIGAEEPEVETAIEVRSAKGRRLDHRSGLKSGSLRNKSMKGDIGDVGGSSAFV